MGKNYIKTVYRGIIRNKFYSLINILGLSMGILCGVLIFLYVYNELTYDKQHDLHGRIYRLESDFTIAGKNELFAITPVPLAPTLKQEFPEIEGFARFSDVGDGLIRYGGKEFYEDSLLFADSTVFTLFTHAFISGTPHNSLKKPNSIVITKRLANKYFGTDDALGKIIISDNLGPLSISGVIEDLPSNLHLKFSGLISMATLEKLIGEENFNSTDGANFWSVSVYSYILLEENADKETILDKFPDFYKRYMAEVGDKINADYQLIIQPLRDIHFNLDSRLQADFPNGNKIYIYIFSFIAFLILLIACINYMNMATACSANRLKGVGIRKIVGAGRNLLIKQFLSESMALTFVAAIVALIALYFILPYFNLLTNNNISDKIFAQPALYIAAFTILIFVGFVSGSYPAFYLSSFSPAEVSKRRGNTLKGRGMLRKILVIVQFSISLVLITGTFIINKQQYYIQNMDLGFQKENILVLPMNDTVLFKKMDAFKQEILKYPGIISVSTSSYVPGRGLSKVIFRVESDHGEMKEQTLNFMFVDCDYLDMMGIELKKGRFFNRGDSMDLSSAFVINETAALKLNWGEDALGKKMQFGFDLEGNVARDGMVIGIIDDFNFSSTHDEISPFVLLLSDIFLDNISVRLKEGEIQASLDFIDNKLKELNIVKPVNYFFLDDYLAGLYKDERRIALLFMIFSGLTIFISCLGLLGLSFFITTQRTKEIGIRKVLGSDGRSIAYLLCKDFLALVLIANLVSWPIAYFFMKYWLRDYVYSINLTYGLYFFFALLAGMLAFIIAMATINVITFKTVRMNPVKVLRYE